MTRPLASIQPPLVIARSNTCTVVGNSIASLCRATDNTSPTIWVPNTAVTVGQIRVPTHDYVAGSNDMVYATCSVAGTTGATYANEPNWTRSGTIVDGTASWTMATGANATLGYQQSSWWHWAMAFMGQPLDTIKVQGLSGRLVADVVSVLDGHINLRPGYIVCGAWTENDLAAVSAASEADAIFDTWQSGVDRIIRAGICPIIFTALPSSNYNSAAKRNAFAYFNRRVRRYARENARVLLFVDWANVYVDPATGYSPLATYTDGVHPERKGAVPLGLRIASVLTGHFTPQEVFGTGPNDQYNLITNPTLYGNGGTVSTVTGVAPDLTTATLFTNGTGGTATAIASVGSKVARTDNIGGEWARFTCAGSGSGTVQGDHINVNNTANTALPATKIVAGDIVRGFSEMRVLANPTDLKEILTWFRFTTGATLNVYPFITSNDAALGGLITVDKTFVFATPRFIVPTGATAFLRYFQPFCSGLANPDFTVDCGRSGLSHATLAAA